MNRIFFYGLFMDHLLLTRKGLHPKVVGPAAVSGYRIHIGERATLVRSKRDRAYGVVIELGQDEVDTLYSEPGVLAYAPGAVEVQLLDTGTRTVVLCYNLPQSLGQVGANPGYAMELARLAGSLAFDRTYVDEIAAFAQG